MDKGDIWLPQKIAGVLAKILWAEAHTFNHMGANNN